MTLQDAVEILRTQATGTTDANDSVFADVIWRYRQLQGNLDLTDSWKQILNALQFLAETDRGEGTVGAFLSCSYSVAEILSTALEMVISEPVETRRRMIIYFAWRVSSGWEAVLAGDIDDIGEHLREEQWARGMGEEDI